MKNRYEVRGDCVVIFINYKKKILETIIEKEDFDIVNSLGGTWCADFKEKQNIFYVRMVYLNKRFYMHRLIMGLPKLLVDHFNGNGLDNRRKVNLRLATKSENGQNQKLRSDNKSGFRGVHWISREGKWAAKMNIGGKCYSVGYFDDKLEAAKAIEKARLEGMPYYNSEVMRNEKDNTETTTP